MSSGANSSGVGSGGVGSSSGGGGISDTEVARWAMDASDWLWGTVQGAFNEKQTTSQIVVDAVIGMIPLVGDATAARDLIAVSTRLADDPKKREETMEWVLFVVLIFALIPVVGGVIKGVGRLLLKAAKEATEHTAVLREIVEFCNRMGHGNAVKWIKTLDLASYQSQVIAKFNALMDKFIEVFTAFKDKLGWFTPQAMKAATLRWIKNFQELKAKGATMIPKAITELNTQLKAVQQAVYKGEWHTLTPGANNVTREAEAKLVEGAPRKLPKLRKGHPPNAIEDYQHVQGWPDLRTGAKYDSAAKTYVSEAIAAFSGPMRAVELKPGTEVLRILRPKTTDGLGNFKSSPWWTAKMPQTSQEWRELFAVLDKFNLNGYFLKYTVPEGTTLKAWSGKAAEQFDGNVGQYLKGGGEQLFVEFPGHIKAAIEALPPLPTGWGETTKLYGFGEHANAAIAEIQLERLSANELMAKKAVGQ
jgi:hypothetical protein